MNDDDPGLGSYEEYYGKSMEEEMGCDCVVKNRNNNESQREWLKRWMCMYHWMQTDYYQDKLKGSQK